MIQSLPGYTAQWSETVHYISQWIRDSTLHLSVDPTTAGLHSSVDQKQYATSLSGPNHCRATQLSGPETVHYISQWARDSTLHVSVDPTDLLQQMALFQPVPPVDAAIEKSKGPGLGVSDKFNGRWGVAARPDTKHATCRMMRMPSVVTPSAPSLQHRSTYTLASSSAHRHPALSVYALGSGRARL